MNINYPAWENQPLLFRFFRIMSIPLTWLLLKTPLRPNEISLIAILTGVLASILFASEYWYTGIVFMFFAIILDFTDGEVSRSRGMQSKEGSYLDKIYIFCVHPALMAGLAIGAYSLNANILIIVAGFVNVIGIFLLTMVINYAKEIVVWRHIKKYIEIHNVDSGVFPKQSELMTSQNKSNDASMFGIDEESRQSKINRSKILSFIKNLICAWDFPYVFCIMAIAIVLQQVAPINVQIQFFNPVAFFIYFYAITYIILTIYFIIINVYGRRVELQYRNVEIKLSKITKFNSGS